MTSGKEKLLIALTVDKKRHKNCPEHTACESVSLSQLRKDGIHRGPYAQGIFRMGSERRRKCLEQLDNDVFWAKSQGSRLRHSATSRRVAGSIPDGFTEKFSST